MLEHIRHTLGSKYYDGKQGKELQQKVLRLSSLKLKTLFLDFLRGNEIDPINVIKIFDISDASPLNINRPSFMGLDTALIKQELRYVDHLYQPLDGFERIALSIFFRYDHIPIHVTV
jgi:hypothetical protein